MKNRKHIGTVEKDPVVAAVLERIVAFKDVVEKDGLPLSPPVPGPEMPPKPEMPARPVVARR